MLRDTAAELGELKKELKRKRTFSFGKEDQLDRLSKSMRYEGGGVWEPLL
jgi:hypothetical protein